MKDPTEKQENRMNDNQAPPLVVATAIMRKHLAQEAMTEGTVPVGLKSATLEGDDIKISFPDWLIKSRDEILERFGEQDGWEYFRQSVRTIWREVGAMK